jgi:hypothetical protein
MAFNPFIGWSQQDLERELRRAQEDYAAGASVESAGSGDVNSRSRIDASPLQRIRQIYAALYALDPEKYPAAAIRPITQTRIVFSQSDYGGTSVSVD